MNINVEEILMVIVAFLIGWFLRKMIKGGLVEASSEVDDCTKIGLEALRSTDTDCWDYHEDHWYTLANSNKQCVGVTAADHQGTIYDSACKLEDTESAWR